MSLKDKARDNSQNFIVALDGPAASGKGRVGAMIAEEFGLKYVQSSLVYRGLAYICMNKRITADDIDSIIQLSVSENIIKQIEGVDLNLEAIGEFASRISSIPLVRYNLGQYLHKLLKETPRIIMEGRDIGTVVAPNADLKIFITADVETRALRRYKQLQTEGKECTLSDVLKQIKIRDLRDSSRDTAPLEVAIDALIIDTSNVTPDQVLQKIRNFIG